MRRWYEKHELEARLAVSPHTSFHCSWGRYLPSPGLSFPVCLTEPMECVQGDDCVVHESGFSSCSSSLPPVPATDPALLKCPTSQAEPRQGLVSQAARALCVTEAVNSDRKELSRGAKWCSWNFSSSQFSLRLKVGVSHGFLLTHRDLYGPGI